MCVRMCVSGPDYNVGEQGDNKYNIIYIYIYISLYRICVCVRVCEVMSAGDDGIDEKKIREYICVLCTSLQCIHEQQKVNRQRRRVNWRLK